jgi:hypothetical protein
MRASVGTAMMVLCMLPAAAEPSPAVDKQVVVYYEPGRFGGWPANHGIWSWGNEILVGYSRGYYKDLGPGRHNIDREKPEEHWFARSLDGGETWTHEQPAEKGQIIPQGPALHGSELPGVEVPEWKDCPGGIDFTHPDFAMTFRMTDHHNGPSRFYYSYDRGHNWEGPFRLPDMGTPGVAARTDYIVDGPHSATIFLTAAKPNGGEGRPFCARTTDGCKTFEFLSWIGPEPKLYSIMPASVRLSENELVTIVRRRDDKPSWNETFYSKDNGKTWEFLNVASETGEGNAPSLIRLKDGRLCYTYGVRQDPNRMCAKLSADGGRSWSDEIVLRDDGGGRDIGYPRSVQRPDGKVVTVYYFWDPKTGPERYIGATIWDPSRIQ